MVPSKDYEKREVETNKMEEDPRTAYEIVAKKSKEVVVPESTTTLLDSLLLQKLGQPGKIISGSKSGYRKSRPENLTVFNANLCIDEGKVWYGDIDVTRLKSLLQEIADLTGKKLYVLFESDGRFEHEEDPRLKQATVVFCPGEKPKLRADLLLYRSRRLRD